MVRKTMKRRAPRRSRPAKALSKAERKEVLALVKAPAEVKYVAEAPRNMLLGTNLATFTSFSSGITSTAEIYSAMPRLNQGTDSGQRIGDTVQPVRCDIDLRLECHGVNNNNSTDRIAHIFVLEAHAVKTIDNYTSIPIGQLLDQGNGGKTNFDGTLYTSKFPINNSQFRVFSYRRVRLVKGFGNPTGTTSATAGTTDAVISPSVHYADVRIPIKLPKSLKYDTASAAYPVNSAPFLVIGFTTNIDRDAASNLVDLKVIGRTNMYYRDS